MRSIDKKGDVNYVLVMIIISIIGFFIYLAFFSSTISPLVSETSDLECRTLIFGNDMVKLPAIDVYFYEINKKCKVDDIKVDNRDKESTLEPIANMMKRCWYRYGEGERDFLSAWDTTGNWCFKCASIEFENKEETIYSYGDLIDYMMQTNFSTGLSGSISYYDYVNVVSVSDESMNQFKSEFEEVKKSLKKQEYSTDLNENAEIQKYILDMGTNVFDYMNSYKVKQINPSEKVYVVYRFDRADKELTDKILDMLGTSSEIVGTYGGVAVGGSFVTNPIGTSKFAVNTIANTASGSVNAVKGAGELAVKSAEVIAKEGTGTFVKKASKTTIKATLNLIKKNPISASALFVFGGFLAIHNDEYMQYVDVMNQEQYYRLCGTERFERE